MKDKNLINVIERIKNAEVNAMLTADEKNISAALQRPWNMI